MPDFVKVDLLRKKYFQLISSQGISLYRYVSIDSADSLKSTVVKVDSFGNKNITNSFFVDKSIKNEDFYIKDVANRQLIFQLLNGSKIFNGKDSFLNWNWNITDEVKELNGYNCRKAIGNRNNVNYVAWFTEDIAINDGPNKINGLPGLIVYVSNPYFEYYATKISIESENKNIEIPALVDKTYTFAEMDEYLMKNRPKNSTRVDGNTTVKTMVIGN